MAGGIDHPLEVIRIGWTPQPRHNGDYQLNAWSGQHPMIPHTNWCEMVDKARTARGRPMPYQQPLPCRRSAFRRTIARTPGVFSHSTRTSDRERRWTFRTGCGKPFIDSGRGIDELMAALRQLSPSPMETIKAIRAVTGISLGQAKDLVDASEAWQDLQPHADRARRLLFEYLAREGALQRSGDERVLRIDLDADRAE